MGKYRVRIIVFSIVLLALALGLACKPRVSLQASKNQIKQGEEVQLTWESKNAKSVELNGQQVAPKGAQTVRPDRTTTYEIIARRGKKEAKDSERIDVEPPPPPPEISISADRSAIEKGQSTTLRWSSANAQRVEITGLGSVEASGQRQVSPTESTTYTATATGPGGSRTASTRITVTEPPPPPKPEPPKAEPPPPPAPNWGALFAQNVKPIFFDFDSAKLRPEAQDTLRNAASWLSRSENATMVFQIEGNCDPRGTEEYNLALGDRRANAAKEFLVSLGIDASRIKTISYGEQRAQGTSEGSPDSPPSWAHDRRDDFVYLSGGGSRGPTAPVVILFK